MCRRSKEASETVTVTETETETEGIQGLGMGLALPDLKTKKKGKAKQKLTVSASKESHVTEALDKLRDHTREAVKGLDSVTSAKDLPNDANVEDWVKQFEELAGSQVPLFLFLFLFLPLSLKLPAFSCFVFVQLNFLALNCS